MLIRDIIEQTEFELANQEPAPEDVNTLQDFVDTIDPRTDTPQRVLTRLQQLQKEYPLLDKITDMIPQTRMAKAVALAVDSLVANRPLDALGHLGRVVGGGVATAATVAQTAQKLSKGDYMGAATQAFGATQSGQDYNRGVKLGQRIGTAAYALANPQQTYTDIKNRIIPQQKPAPIDSTYNTQQAQVPVYNYNEELQRILELADRTSLKKV